MTRLLNFRNFVLEKLLLQYHPDLNPAMFDGGVLRREARERFLNRGKEFRAFCGIPLEAVVDYYFTGSCANFNYTSLSDVDVHVVANFGKIAEITGESEAALTLLYKEKKREWMSSHIDDKFNGYPIETYVQSLEEKTPLGQGIYSLVSDGWLVLPVNQHLDFEHDVSLKRKISYLKHSIDSSISKGDLSLIQKIKDKLKKMRGLGLTRAGEFDHSNLTFKELRNKGYLDKINQALHGSKVDVLMTIFVILLALSVTAGDGPTVPMPYRMGDWTTCQDGTQFYSRSVQYPAEPPAESTCLRHGGLRAYGPGKKLNEQ